MTTVLELLPRFRRTKNDMAAMALEDFCETNAVPCGSALMQTDGIY
jgi:hypothetical protein